jgi:hypothetical protein
MIDEKRKSDEELRPRDRNFVGLLLVGLGLLVLLSNLTQTIDFGILILPTLGLIFLAWGFYTRRFGFIVPGCILTGLGIPMLLMQTNLDLSGEKSGALFVLGLGLGFGAMSLFAPFFKEKNVWWPLIPGAILVVVGVLLFVGGDALRWLTWLGMVWPLILIGIGAYILVAPRLRQH